MPLARPLTIATLILSSSLAFACSSATESTPANDGASSGGNGFGDSKNENEDKTTSKVDIILVVDSSASMDDYITQVRANVNRFAATIGDAGLDYTVTVIAQRAQSATQTTNAQGFPINVVCVPPPLGGIDCADRAPTFFHVDQIVDTSDSLAVVLSTYDRWRSHLRADALKVFVEVSDDESSLPHEEFERGLFAKAPAGMFGTADKRNYVFHSIVSKPTAAEPPTIARCASAQGSSLEYQKLSVLTGGVIQEICKPDYGVVLASIAKSIVERAKAPR